MTLSLPLLLLLLLLLLSLLSRTGHDLFSHVFSC